MLSWTDRRLGYRIDLVGQDLQVFRLHRRFPGSRVLREPLGVLAKWSFESHEVAVSFPGMPPEMIAAANGIFGPKLRELDPPRQEGLFPHCCSVCGVDRNTFPETAVRHTNGNIVETDGKPWVSPDEPIRWECHVCGRLVCRNCTLVWPESGGQFYYHTYCSEACRAAAPRDFHDEDENMR